MSTTGTRARRASRAADAAPHASAATPAAAVGIARWIVLAIGALAFLFPFYYMVIGSLQTEPDPTPAGAFPQPGEHHAAELRRDQ